MGRAAGKSMQLWDESETAIAIQTRIKFALGPDPFEVLLASQQEWPLTVMCSRSLSSKTGSRPVDSLIALDTRFRRRTVGKATTSPK